MREIFKKLTGGAIAASMAAAVLSGLPAAADELTDRVAAGETIRIGFSNEPPWAYPGENGEPLGFVHVIVLGALEKMGITEVEPVVTDWGNSWKALALIGASLPAFLFIRHRRGDRPAPEA